MAYSSFENQHPDGNENPWQTRSVETVYENPWIAVSHREVINPSGGNGIYGVVHFKNIAIGIVPIDSEGYTWLVGQYRYPLNRYSWEIPEGGCPEGQSPLAAAQRELMEETGFSASEWTPLMDMHLSNSVSDEYGLAFVAQGLTPGTSMPEPTELLELRRVPLSGAVEMVMDGRISDVLSMVALLKTNELLRRGRLLL